MDQSTQEFIQRFEREADSIDGSWQSSSIGWVSPPLACMAYYHLGQTLHTPEGDWCLLILKASRSARCDERRSRSSPLKDVAGMIRSLAYARAFASTSEAPSWTDESRRLNKRLLMAISRPFPASIKPWP